MAARRVPVRTGDLVAAEWIKLWSVRSTPVACVLGVALSLYLAAFNASRGVPPVGGPAGAGGPASPVRAAFDGYSWLPAMLGAGLVGAQSTSGEFVSGLMRTLLAAVPDRRRVAAAKLAVAAAVAAGAGVLIAAGGLALAASISTGAHSPAGSDPARAIAASAALTAVCALAGVALGTLLRHAATVGGAVCALLGFLPVLLRPDGNRWAADAANTLPYYAWGRLVAADPGAAGSMTVPVAWATLAAWAAAAAALTVLALDRRDV